MSSKSKLAKFKSVGDRTLLIAIGSLISVIIWSLVLLLLDHPIKYVLYFFGISLAVIFFMMTSKYSEYKFYLKTPISYKAISYCFVVSSTIILISNIYSNGLWIVSFALSLIVSFFLPGWVFLRILGTGLKQSKLLDSLVLSFCLSLGISAAIFQLGLSFLKENIYFSIILSGVYLGISAILALWERFYGEKDSKRQSSTYYEKKGYRVIDIVLLSWILIFFVFIILSVYPQMVFYPSADIVRHFSQSKTLTLAPDIYTSQYPWFHFSWALLMELSSNPPMWLFQSGIAFLSILSIFAFYIMSRQYLQEIDRRAPIVSTIFFFVLSGFGWIYFSQNLSNVSDPIEYFDILWRSYGASNADIGIGIGPAVWLWLRPLTTGFTIFFCLLYLMRRHEFARYAYIVLVSLLTLTLSQFHFSELVIFVFLLLVIAIFLPTTKLRIREMSFAALLGIAASQIVNSVYQIQLGFEDIPTSYDYQFIMIGILGLSFILTTYKKRPRPRFPTIKISSRLLIIVALSVYFILLFQWYSNSESFVSHRYDISISTIYAIPWEFYPMQMGIVGAFAIPGIVVVVKNHRSHPVIIFAVLAILIFVLARTITYVNASITSTGFWERRLIEMLYASCSILAAVAFLRLIEWMKSNSDNPRRYKGLLIYSFLSLLLMGGILSTFLSVEYQLKILANFAKTALTEEQRRGIEGSIDNFDPHSILLTVSKLSKTVAEFASLEYIVDYYDSHLWASDSPEYPLNFLYSSATPVLIYLQQRDIDEIKHNKLESGYIWSHLAKMGQVKKGMLDGGTVVQLPNLSPPSPQSETVLVLEDQNKSGSDSRFTYDTLSLAGLNYTTAYLSDINSIRNSTTIVVPTESLGAEIIDYRKKYGFSFEKLIILNTDGYQDEKVIHFDTSDSGNHGTLAGTWEVTGYGTGQVGVPRFLQGSDDRLNGLENITFDVGTGNNKFWEISKVLSKPQNLGNYDFMKFNWFGKGDGKKYVVELSSGPYPGTTFEYMDTWKGWRSVVLPLQLSDMNENPIFGIRLQTSSGRDAVLDRIDRINLRTAISNSDLSGQFRLSDFSFGNMVHSNGIVWKLPNSSVYVDKPIQSANVSVYPLSPSEDYSVAANYSNTNTPFALTRAQGSYEIIYLNVYPIIQSIKSEKDITGKLYSALGNAISQLGLSMPFHEDQNLTEAAYLGRGGVAAFNRASFAGNLNIVSSSAILDVDAPVLEVNLDGINVILQNVSRIVPIDIEQATVESQEGIMSKGSGFYTHIFLNNGALKLVGNPANILVEHDDGKNETAFKGKKIEIELPRANLIMRQPTVDLKGTAVFDNFYGYQELYNKIKVLGKDLIISGQVNFNTVYSDVFAITRGFDFEGDVVRSQPIYPYDEIAALGPILSTTNFVPYALAGVALFLFYTLFRDKKKSKL